MSVDEIYAMFPNLKERASSQGTRLSGGEQQMLAVARILRTGARCCCSTRSPKAWRR
jgi:branched-chain amino acid transport system ATP-binding protein